MSAIQQVLDYVTSRKGQRNQIVDIYNTYKPLPRRYKVKYSDMLCATFVSSIFIYLGWTDIVPPECGARQLYQNMEGLGRGIQSKTRVPKVGDLIFFGNSKYVSGIQHVGIVTEVVNNKQIYYYDIQSVVGRHTCPVGYTWIWGYGMPDYAKKDGSTPAPEPTPTPTPEPAPASEIKAGDLVRIKEGAKWYSGSTIKASILAQNWYVLQVKGDRAVLNQNEKKTSAIMSPINVNNIELVYKTGTSAPASSVVEQPVAEETVTISLQLKKSKAEALYAKAQGAGKTLNEWLESLV